MMDLRLQYAGLKREIGPVLEAVCDEQDFVLGPRVEAFERAVAGFLELPHAVGVKSGSDALLLALLSLGIGPGDEVVTTPFSFFATAGAVVRAGAKPVFADVRPDTLMLDPRAARAAIGPRTRAIIVVHLFGLPADLDELGTLASERGVALIEDAAQAFGATYRGRPVGSLGLLGCLSFHPSKPLGAFGDAGAVVTADPALAVRVAALRTHGAEKKYEHELSRGGNQRIDALQAAILEVKLRHVQGWLARRREHAAAYDRALAGLAGLGLPPRIPGSDSACSAYTLRVAGGRRDALRAHLHARGVESAVHYPKPLHLQPALRDHAVCPRALPNAEAAAGEVLSIPVYPELSPAQRASVVEAVQSFWELP